MEEQEAQPTEIVLRVFVGVAFAASWVLLYRSLAEPNGVAMLMMRVSGVGLLVVLVAGGRHPRAPDANQEGCLALTTGRIRRGGQ